MPDQAPDATPPAADIAATAVAANAPRSGQPAPAPPEPPVFHPPELGGGATGDASAIELLDDVELDVKIELGRTEMYIEDVLRLGVGSVIALERLAGDPVDVYVNEQLVARGEVLVLNDNFCVRINDILSPVPELDQPA